MNSPIVSNSKDNVSPLARIGAVLVALMLLVGTTPAFAATEYIASWKDYEKTLPKDEKVTWNVVADAMDILLNAAEEEFQAGNNDAAWEAVNQAYYGYYEITGFERYAMSHIAGSRKTEVENQFSLCKSIAKNGGTTAEFNDAVEGLRAMLHTDANKLDGVEEAGGSDNERQSGNRGIVPGRVWHHRP